MEKQQTAVSLLRHADGCSGRFQVFTEANPWMVGIVPFVGVICTECRSLYPDSRHCIAAANTVSADLKDEPVNDAGAVGQLLEVDKTSIRDRLKVYGRELKHLAERLLGQHYASPRLERSRNTVSVPGGEYALRLEQLGGRPSFHAVSSLLAAGSEFAAASYGGRP